ncbi:(Fe-S)-binding protein [Alistipes sp. OttesenSCG-928-B03]|nr:(Fe-S)-binding protein [Alistipes sp. OttesenSCG-928-B03]
MDGFLRYYDHFVLPFTVGVIALFSVIIYKYVRWFVRMPREDKLLVKKNIFTRKTIEAVWEVCRESLFHVKIWKTNPVLGYMHMSFALGWFLLIAVGWVEAALHLDASMVPLHAHVFFKFFGPGAVSTTSGKLLGFVMDALLLFVLSGVALALFKRIRSRALGMRKATKHTWGDRLALMSLWFIFPARLVAESAASGIDGGHTFLTGSIGSWMLETFGIEQLFNINAGAWWFYSLVLGMFFVAMPFSRYMHIFTEIPLIFLRKYKVRSCEEFKTFDHFQIEACSRCGICIDPCQLQADAGIDNVQSVYFLRDRRYHKLTPEVANTCLMCGRCEAKCPVGIELNMLRLNSRQKYNDLPAEGRYDYLNAGLKARLAAADESLPAPDSAASEPAITPPIASKVGYFAGCMTLLAPKILRSMEEIFQASGDDVWWADRDGGVCCGRPLKLSGEVAAARKMMDFNKELFVSKGITTLVTSCPICLKVFREDYDLPGIEVLHHSQYILRLMEQGRLNVEQTGMSYTYHDPCELGRGCGIYDEPRAVIGRVGELTEVGQTREHAYCCGSSLANIPLNDAQQGRIGAALGAEFEATGARTVVTSCPLCKKSIARHTSRPVADLAEIVAEGLRVS